MSRKLLLFSFLIMAMSTQFSSVVDARHFFAVCTSSNSNTNFSTILEGEDYNDLDTKCRSYVKPPDIPIISNIREVPCAHNDRFYGCELGTTIDIKPCPGTHPPTANDAVSEHIEAFSTARVCKSIDKKTSVTSSFCGVYSYKLGSQYCTHPGGGSCISINSKRLTVTDAVDNKVYCWTVYNGTDHIRQFTIWVK